MPNAQAICSSFKIELAQGVHNFTVSTGDVIKIALYTSSATYGAATTAYSATNEITGTGYTAGGLTLTNVTPFLSSTTGVIDFADAVWTGATFTARGAMIYNSSKSNKAICTLDFGADKTVTADVFTVVFPTPDNTTGFIRIG